MELRSLSYFVAVAESGTVSAAAEKVHVTQPAVSRQVRQLERELRVDLFRRDGGRLTLSPAGLSLLPSARDLLARADDFTSAARILSVGRLARFTIAASSTTLTDIVAPFLTTLTPDDPVPSVLDANSVDTLALLRDGADVAITAAQPPGTTDHVEILPLPLLAHVPSGHVWATRDAVGLTELASVDLIGLPAHFPARSALDAALATARLPALDMLEASNGTIAQALAAAGRGVAVVSDDPRFGLRAVPLVDATGAPVELRLRCAWESRHTAADLLADIAGRLASWVETTYAR